jgi:hypothetical protein
MSRAARGAGALLATAALLGASAGAAQAAATPALAGGPVEASASLPADLVALEQKTAALRFNTERLTLQIELQSAEGLLGPGSPSLIFLVAGKGQVSASPAEGSFTLSLFGQTSEIREVGGSLYTYEPSVAKFDGGRSWVRSKAQSPASALAVGPVGLGDGMVGAEGSFAGLLALVRAASSVQETGPAIVDDQPTVEFTATIDPRKLAGWNKLLSSGHGQGLAKELRAKHAPTSRLELFLAANGLPMRIRFTLTANGTIATLTSDTLALEVPVDVHAPPAREVVGEARLKVLQARQRARERASVRRALRRICAKLPPKPAARCRLAAGRGGHTK